MARAEGEAEKALGRLLSQRFACEADARRALEEASGRLPHHRPVYLGVQEERRRGRVGHPRKGEAPLPVGYRLLARLGSWSGRGGAWGASSWPRTSWTGRPCRPEVLGRYKDQTRTVERGFRFLQDPLFFTGSTFLKRPERVMALALLVYALGEWALRRGLAETGSSLPNQKGRPTQRPTLRWVFQLFIWVRLLGAGRYYLLE